MSDNYKPQNIILVGVIPGPKEPKKTINSYLTPLVLELQEAWTNGFNFIDAQNRTVCVKLCVSCVTCDIPASKKVSGFLSHNAALGCNKCLKKFDVRFGQRTNFSGYNRENWHLCSKEQHNNGLEKIRMEYTKTGLQSAESKYGIRYSVLMSLPYYDPVRFTAIDTMHNLLLGTAKHAFDVWVQSDILTKVALKKLEESLNHFTVPSGMGRLPSRISSCYGAFTANQWKTWVSIYSPVLLKDILPPENYRCWLLFVRSCSILLSYCFRQPDVTTADLLLLQFCREFHRLHGNDCCTYNMHLHLHLKQTILDFGPAHASWCFAFERFNGILGSFHTNKRSIEPQIMRKFCQNQAVHDMDLPVMSELNSILPEVYKQDMVKNSNSLKLLPFAIDRLDTIQSFANEEGIVSNPPFFDEVFTTDMGEQILTIYKQLYSNCSSIKCSQFYRKFGKITLADDLIGSTLPGANSQTSSVIMAFWCNRGDRLDNIDYSCKRVGVVQFFFHHQVYIGSETSQKHTFAYVHWKQLHEMHNWFATSAIVCTNSYEAPSACCFIPVSRLFCRCASIVKNVNFNNYSETVFVATPVPFKHTH